MRQDTQTPANMQAHACILNHATPGPLDCGTRGFRQERGRLTRSPCIPDDQLLIIPHRAKCGGVLLMPRYILHVRRLLRSVHVSRALTAVRLALQQEKKGGKSVQLAMHDCACMAEIIWDPKLHTVIESGHALVQSALRASDNHSQLALDAALIQPHRMSQQPPD